ncbi:MAG: patatin-like phospholipase family protein [Candidatus Promineifilaceae bacterium]|nr:patatin-like phospholipase family protein [Candidatus Promineifilaceae bacterium]
MQYDLVFEGGGAKGMVFAGALEVFFGRGHSFGRLLGTSAGAITATFLAAGYTVEEIMAALAETDEQGQPVFAAFMGPPAPFRSDEIADSGLRRLLRAVNLRLVPDVAEERVDDAVARTLMEARGFRNLFAFVERGGWYAADAFLAWLRRKLDTARPDGTPRAYSGMTLAQYQQATGVDLSLVAADTTDQKLLVLNHRTAPDCPLVYAVRMSMSVPLLWEEVEWQADWGHYRGRDLSGHAVVDGGLLSNFPLELFVSRAPQVTAVMGDKEAANVLGMIIDESLPVPGAPPKPGGSQAAETLSLADLKTARRLQALVETVTRAHDKNIIDTFAHLVVRLPAGGYGTTEFDMTPERRAALIAVGRQTMTGHLGAAPDPFLEGAFDFSAAASGAAGAAADRIALGLLAE